MTSCTAVEIVDASLRFRASKEHNGSSNGWRLGEVVDILRTPSRTKERKELLNHIVRWHGSSFGQPQEVLRRLERAFGPVPHQLHRRAMSDEASQLDKRYDKFLQAKKAACDTTPGTNQKKMVRTVFTYELALRSLRAPNRRNLSSTRAKAEMLDNTPIARAAVSLARKHATALGRRTNWDTSKMLDITEQRCERRELVSGVHKYAVSLNAFGNKLKHPSLAFSLHERRLFGQQDRAVARRKKELRKKERQQAYLGRKNADARKATLERQASCKMPGPNGLNVAVQPFLKGEGPFGTLRKSDIEGLYKLPGDRCEDGQIHALNLVLHFPSAAKQLLLLQGRSEEEAADCMKELLAQRTPLLRRKRFRELTGIISVVQYKPGRFKLGGELEQAFHRIAWSQLGFFAGQDIAMVLSDEETYKIRERLQSCPTGSISIQRKKPAECYAALKPFILGAVRELGKARPHQLRKLCQNQLDWPVAHETIRRYCDILAKDGLLRRRVEFDNRKMVKAGACRQRIRRFVYMPAKSSA